MHDAIFRAVDQLVARHGTRDPFRIALYERITVLRPSLPAGVRGFYQGNGTQRIIQVSAHLPPLPAQAVCAHELGHAILHPAQNSPLMAENPLHIPGRSEREAELFAFYLLDGANAVHEQGTLEKAAAVTGLSEQTLRLGLADRHVF